MDTGATLLHDFNYYKTDNCVAGTIGWVGCPHKYNQLWILDMAPTQGKESRMAITRNEHPGTNHPDYQLNLAGFADGAVRRWQPPVSVGAVSYLIAFDTWTPFNLALQLNNAEQGT